MLLWVASTHENKAMTAMKSANATSTSAAVVLSTATSSPATSIQSTAATTSSSNTSIHFEIVTTQAQQERGLGGREVIPDNYAMLFVFPTDSDYGFWMKDMLTSIDMIWVSDSGKIVAIDESVSPSTYPQVFYPPVPVKYVLETKAGFAREKGWKIGTQVSLPLPY